MKFHIITPSLNQLDYLKRCVASVRDQVGPRSGQRSDGRGQKTDALIADLRYPISESESPIRVHHHIQDACSSDGTPEWLAEYVARQPSTGTYQLTFASEADVGMYDAINKGVAFSLNRPEASFNTFKSLKSDGLPCSMPHAPRASHDSVVSWLNCDEQYLSQTLSKVAEFFSLSASVDILFGGMLMVDPDGDFLACRKAMPMRRLFLEASYLYNFSCSMFVRQEFWEKIGGFDTRYQNAGDEEWVRRAMVCGAKTAILTDYLSAFSYAEDNLSSADGALQEHEALKRSGSVAGRGLRLPFNLLRLAEKALRGGWIEKRPLAYEIYVADLAERRHFSIARPLCRWPDTNAPYLLSHRLK